MIASYIAAHAETLSVATLVRRIRDDLEGARGEGPPEPMPVGKPSPPLCRGLSACAGSPQREAKPLLREDLFRVLDAMGEGVKERCY